MQCVRATSTAAMFLLLGTIAPAYAQRDQQNERQQGRQQQGAPPAAQQQRTQRQSQQPQARRQQQQQRQRSSRPSNNSNRSVPGSRQPRGSSSGDGYGRVPGRGILPGSRVVLDGGTASIALGRSVEAMAVTTFLRTASVSISGARHWFRMYSRPTMYMGYPRFSYSGFSFLLLDPYPEYWGDNWYATDDVYVDYDDGYYLYNRRHPSVRLAITVAL